MPVRSSAAVPHLPSAEPAEPWPSAPPTASTSSSSAPAPAATRPPSVPGSWASRSRSSTPSKIGGTCLHVGCIPTKAMLESADLYAKVKNAADFGIVTGETSVDYAVVAKRRGQIVDRLPKGLMSLVKKNKVEYIRGRGTLRAARRSSRHARRRRRTSRRADARRERRDPRHGQPGQVAARARAGRQADRHQRRHHRPTTLPASIIVVGGGAVGVEFASFYRDMGVEVTVLEYLPDLVPLEDARGLRRSWSAPSGGAASRS